MSRRARTILVTVLVLAIACAVALPMLLRTRLFLDHATAEIARDPERPQMPLLTVTGPAGWTVITYGVVLGIDRRPSLGGRGRSGLGLTDNELRVYANYLPPQMPARELPLETHVRLVPQFSPAAAVAVPSTPEERAAVGVWVIVTEDPTIYDRLERVAPALQAAPSE